MWQRRRIAIVLVSALAGAGAVSGCVGDDPMPVGASGGVAGDGGGGGGDVPDKVERFLGTWTTSTATQTLNCAAARTQKDITISLEVKKGTTSDILANNTLAPSCVLRANVVGDTATFVDGQTCKATFPDGSTDTYTYAGTSTFKLTLADGAQATMTLNATISNSPSGATCTFAESAPYTKR